MIGPAEIEELMLDHAEAVQISGCPALVTAETWPPCASVASATPGGRAFISIVPAIRWWLNAAESALELAKAPPTQ